jgi:hypothetical protein
MGGHLLMELPYPQYIPAASVFPDAILYVKEISCISGIYGVRHVVVFFP